MQRDGFSGKRLRRLMDMAGLDELALANKLGVTPQTIFNWLGDRCKMNLVYRRALQRMERRLQAKQAVKA
jgi:transcriptional regulator with XRE-family HTH domain